MLPEVEPEAWTLDGRVLVSTYSSATLGDFLLLEQDSESIENVLAGADENVGSPSLSPDERWMVYEIHGGRQDMEIRPFPDARSAGPWSLGTGVFPLWTRPDEVVFLRGDTLYRQPVTQEPPFVHEEPTPIVSGPYFATPLYARPYDYDRVNDRFLVIRHDRSIPSLVVVDNVAADIAASTGP